MNFGKLKFWWVWIRSILAQEISQSSLCFQLQSPWGPMEVIKSTSPESLVFRCFFPQLMSMVLSRDSSKPSSGRTFRLHINCTYSSERNDEIHLLVIPLASVLFSAHAKNSTSPEKRKNVLKKIIVLLGPPARQGWQKSEVQYPDTIHDTIHPPSPIRITSYHIVWRYWASTPGAKPGLVPPPVAMQCHGLGVK